MRSFASIHAHDPERAALAASVAFVAMGTTTGAVMRFVTSLRQGIGQPASPSSPSPQPQTLEHDEALHGVDPDFIITAVRFARPGDKGDTKRAESTDHASKLSSSQSAPSAKIQERTRSTRTVKGSKVDQSIGADGDGRSSLSRPASIVGSKWEPSNSKHLTELQVRVKINFQRDKDVPPSTLIEKYGQKYVRELVDYKTYLARAKKAGRRVGRVKVPPADWTPSTSPSADGPDASAHEAKGKKRARSERHDEEESLPQKRARVGSEASESVTPSEPSIPSSSSQPRPANATKSTSARSRRASYVPSLGWRSKDYVSSLTIKTVSTKVPYLQRATPKSYRRSLKTQLAASKWADSRSALLSDRDRKVVASFNALKTVNAAFLKRKFGAPFAQSMLEYRKHRTELQELKAREIKDVLSSFRRGPSASPLLRRG
ncbi:hypothetical protein OC842_005791 [Tilletia horrida]|uniref:Uncharacterized protein n=1 Tax=Tilletia horrida TaxID=155126 RepID=A0AAN6G8J9_9BASI|nr:hypothetical protein OC842_005791 [Tilletia horrida]